MKTKPPKKPLRKTCNKAPEPTAWVWAALAWLALLAPAWAQQGVPCPQDQGAYQAGNQYFEGQLVYSFETEGELGQALYQTNPIDRMMWAIRQGDYIVHTFSSATASGKDPLTQQDLPAGLPADADIPLMRAFPRTRLYIADSGQTFVVDAENQRYFAEERRQPATTPGQPPGSDTANQASALKPDRPRRPGSLMPAGDDIPAPDGLVALPTGETGSILGYPVQVYRVETAEDVVTYYVSPCIRINLGHYRDAEGTKAHFLTPGLGGMVPLKLVRRHKTDDLTVTMRVVDVRWQTYSADEFRIPQGWTRYGYDFRW